MVIVTGHRTFDRQANLIALGDVTAKTQLSRHIREWNETVSVSGAGVQPGYLQNRDLEVFGELPQAVLTTIQETAQDKPAILYKFFHTRAAQQIVHGYVLTGTDGELLGHWVVGPTYKSRDVIRKCMELVVVSKQEGWLQRLVKLFKTCQSTDDGVA